MSDARSAAFLNGTGKAGWDIEATEACFPIRVDYQGKQFEVYVALTQPYDGDLLIEAIGKARGGYRRTQAGLENIGGDDDLFAAMTEKLFIRMEGTTVNDPVAQRRWLDQNFKLKTRIIRTGLGGITVRTREELTEPTPANELELLPIALDFTSDVRIDTFQELWDPLSKKKLAIEMQHVFRPETEKDWKRWSRTAAEQFSRPRNLWTEGVNWWARAELYDQMVKSISGMFIGDEPCRETNKAAWLPRVPIWHKFLVIGEVFEEARVKN